MEVPKFYMWRPVIYGNGEGHSGDALSNDEYDRGGGPSLIGPLSHIEGVTIDRNPSLEIQRQMSDVRLVVYHNMTAENSVHLLLNGSGLQRQQPDIRVQ